MEMKTNKGVMAALLGIAMLAMPMAASAHDYSYRGPVRPYQAYRPINPAVNFGSNFRAAPPVALANRVYAPNRFYSPNAFNAPPTAYAPPPRYYGYAPTPPVCAAGPAPSYAMGAPAYYPQPYGYMPPAMMNGYGSAMAPGLANMVNQRNSAQYLYRLAMQRGNYDRAHHLSNDIAQLNKNIANARWHSGIGPAYGSFNSPVASNYGYANTYGYGNNSLGNMVGPLLGGFIH
jgi:hypothetical protein